MQGVAYCLFPRNAFKQAAPRSQWKLQGLKITWSFSFVLIKQKPVRYPDFKYKQKFVHFILCPLHISSLLGMKRTCVRSGCASFLFLGNLLENIDTLLFSAERKTKINLIAFK